MTATMDSLAQCPYQMNFDRSLPNVPMLDGPGHGEQLLEYRTAAPAALSLFPSEHAYHSCSATFRQFCLRYIECGPFEESLLATFRIAQDDASFHFDVQWTETMPAGAFGEVRLSVHMLHCLASAQVFIPFALTAPQASDGTLVNHVCALSPTALIAEVVRIAQRDARMMQRLRLFNSKLTISPAEAHVASSAVLLPGDVIASDRVCRAIASVLLNQASKDQVNCSKSATDAAAEKNRMGLNRDRQNRGDAEVHGRPAISRDRSRSPLDRRTKRAEQHVSCVQKASRIAPRYTASDSPMPNDAERRAMAALQRKERLQRRRLCRGASPGAETPEPKSPPPPKRRAAAPSHSKRKRSVSLPQSAAKASPQPKRRAPALEAPAVKAPPLAKRRAPVSPPPAAKASPQQPKRRVATPEAPQASPTAVRKGGRERKQRMDLKQVEAEADEASPPQQIVTPKQIMGPRAPASRPTVRFCLLDQPNATLSL